MASGYDFDDNFTFSGRCYCLCNVEIAEALKRDGFEVEAETELRNARKLLERAEA